jgi:hypothetical protein
VAVAALIGTAVLNADVLVDSLVGDVIDGLRDQLHPQFGVRSYRVYRVIRTWSGRTSGDGKYTDAVAELIPYPLVAQWDGYKFVQQKCGVGEAGEIKLTEISLTYSAADLCPRDLRANQELFYAIGDANGQASPISVWSVQAPPYVDRIKDLGWVLRLLSAESAPAWAGP